MAASSSSSSSSSSLVFTVRRREAELITPAKPTPHEFKNLSDIDNQNPYHIPVIQFYRNHHDDVSIAWSRRDPVQVIRKALAETLVFYYPFAGRLREAPAGKLVVECTGEGVIFVEADADVRLDQFGDVLQPPFPQLEELIFEVPGSGGVLNSPLLLIQVTRLTCGGFILAIRLNHIMSDAQGLVQFMTAVGEIARGAPSPSILPVWQRELLNFPNPPQIPTVQRQQRLVLPPPPPPPPNSKLLHRSLFFGSQEVLALRKHVPHHLSTCSTVDILSACLWKCRTIALNSHNPNEEVRISILFNARGKFRLPLPLPLGYYGNAFGYAIAVSTAEKLRQNPVGYALELIMKAKKEMTVNDDDNDNEQSTRNMRMMAMMKKSCEDHTMRLLTTPYSELVRTCYVVTDTTRAKFADVDFGWGKALYGGPAKLGRIFGLGNFYISSKNNNGDNIILVPVCFMERSVMDKFIVQLESMIRDPPLPRTAHLHQLVQSKINNSPL